MTYIFPTLLITIDLGAALCYGVAAEWKLATYWVAAAVLTACVTF